MFYLKCSPKLFYTQKQHFPVKKCIIFWIDFTSVLSILQKLKIANNSIMILGYSNDKYILWGILFWLTSWFSLPDSTCSTNHHAVPSEKF